MLHNPLIEEIIADSMTLLMIRSNKLNNNEQRAIGQEFREWLMEGYNIDDILILNKTL